MTNRDFPAFATHVADEAVFFGQSGLVLDPAGKQIGTFNSVWRRDPDGRWRVVFDKGCPVCDCAPAR